MIEISCFCENVKQVTQMKVDTTTLEIYLATPIYVNLYITYDATVSLLLIQQNYMHICTKTHI